MPAITFPEYVQHNTHLLNHAVATGEVVLNTLQVDQRSAMRALMAGVLQFGNGSERHFREHVDMTQDEQKIMYAYHYQGVEHTLIFLYDNAAHRLALPQREPRHVRLV